VKSEGDDDEGDDGGEGDEPFAIKIVIK